MHRHSSGHSRRSTALRLRPAIQRNCRKCHEALSSATDYCWMCGTRVAGIRWQRLLLQALAIAVPVALLVAYAR